MSKQSKTWIAVALTTTFDKNDTFVKDFLKGPVGSSETKAQLEIEVKDFIKSWLSQHRIPFSVDDPFMNSVAQNVTELSVESQFVADVANGKVDVDLEPLTKQQLVAKKWLELRSAFMYVFDNFAVVTSDVMQHLEKNRSETLDILDRLESVGLISGDYNESEGVRTSNRKARPGTEKVWQANETYDNSTRDAATTRFHAIFPGSASLEVE